VIDLYGMASPNVIKIAIMLEELALPYRVSHVDVMHGAGRTPEFQALNPLGKVPVIVDSEGSAAGQPVFESGAILIYLAETHGPALLPATGVARWEVLKWLMFQVAFAGPMLGQLNHFQMITSESGSYAATRYQEQAARVYGDIERRLGAVPWLGGAEYSIADVAMYPWAPYLKRHGFNFADFPKLTAWRERIDVRPAVPRAYKTVYAAVRRDPHSAAPVSGQDLDRFFARRNPGPISDLAAYSARGDFSTYREE
jgi:GST-like protein